MNINRIYEKYCFDNKQLSNIQINITGQCNANCSFCFQDGSNKSQLDYNTLIQLISDAHALGAYAVVIAGGEPFIYKRLHEVILYIRHLGMEVMIVTNGHLITDDDIEFMASNSITNVGVSFHTIDISKYCDLFGVGQPYYHRSIENIKKMLDIGLNVSIACTVTRDNYKELDAISAFFLQLGVKKDSIAFNNLIEGKRNLDETSIDHQEMLAINDSPLNLNNSSRMCCAGRSSLVINYDGDVQICSFMNISLGNINHQSLPAIWHESMSLTLYQSITEAQYTQCFSCQKESKCNICMAKNILQTGNALQIPAAFCQTAKLMTGGAN